MKTTKMLTILVMALALMVWTVEVSEATPMGTAFTYQGRLIDANSAADGLYDFEFEIYDDPCTGTQQGSTVDVNDLDVIDGYFTVELDFGSSVFDGDARWLEIDVRPGDSNDANDFVTLSPRQEVTPVPYALQTRGIFVDDALNVGIGTTNPLLKLHIAEAGMAALAVHETDNDVAGILQADTDYVSLSSAFNHPIRFMINDIMRVFIDTNGNVGIGITNPGAKLEVAGQVKITGGSPGNGKVLTSDANGLGNWQSLAVDGDSDSSNELNTSLVLDGNNLELTDNGGTLTTSLSALVNDGGWTIAGSDIYSTLAGNVGIGTQTPDAKLDIVGDVNVTGSVAASDAVIMATNTGSGDGVEGKSWGSSGHGVEGWALWSGPGANYGGYFRAEGSGGYGVYGYASNSGDYENYGGYFMASGEQGRGVYGFVMGDNGHAVHGMAFDSGNVENYGGYFQASGASGRGVYGEASKTGVVENYGGYFTAAGSSGVGVFGKATGSTGRGVYGGASATTGTNYGGYFEAAGISGRGVYGEASAIFGTNYGGWFAASGSSGTGVYGSASGGAGMGVYGEATDSGVATNYGGYFQAAGSSGRGVYGKASNSGAVSPNYGGYFEASGSSGRGVYGWASNAGNVTNYGGWFEAWGDSGYGVYGKAWGNGIAVYGYGGGYDFYAGNTSSVDYGSASSIRWKSDVRAIDDPLGKILRLRGVYFNWDAEHGGGHDVGMIAEEVGEVLPEIVEYEENGVDATGMDYSKVTPLLVEAVKALKTQADEREKQLAKKDVEIAELKERLLALEACVAKLTISKEGGL